MMACVAHLQLDMGHSLRDTRAPRNQLLDLFVERVDLGTRFGQGLRHHDGLSLLTLGRQKAADFPMIRGPVWPAAGQSGTAACRTRYRPTITRVASTPRIAAISCAASCISPLSIYTILYATPPPDLLGSSAIFY